MLGFNSIIFIEFTVFKKQLYYFQGIFNRKLLWVIVAILITGITITVLLSAILPTTNSIQGKNILLN